MERQPCIEGSRENVMFASTFIVLQRISRVRVEGELGLFPGQLGSSMTAYFLSATAQEENCEAPM